MRLINIKKPTKLNPKWTITLEHQGQMNVYVFDDYKSSLGFYVKAKHEVGERFNK
jgi:hypothetical protein